MGTGPDLVARHRDGTEFPVAISLAAVHTDAGQIVALVMRDDSDRKQAEAKYRWMIEVAPDAILGVDASGSIEMVNAQCQRLFGYRRDELIGQPVEILIPRGLRPVDAGQIAAGFEVAALHKDGGEIPVEVSLSALETDGGRLTMAAVRDITDRRRFERQLREQNVALERAGQGKDNFLATMSHEIRTPMNGVIGLSALLLDTDLEPMQRRYASGIHSAGTALLGVINDILDYSKFEAGKLVLDINNIDLSAILTEVAALVGPTAQDSVRVVTRRGARLPAKVRGDGGRLRQILLNLVGNAVKFTPLGSVTVRADLAAGVPGDPETVMVRFEITDTGIGIAAADSERLFEPFTQADSSTTRNYGGTGLGLAIARQLTAAMGGTIGVDSEPGQGSTFWCLIPFGLSHGADLETEPSAASDIAGLRLLVVDTGPSRATLQESLRSWKMTSVAADSAADALHALRQAADRGRPFDVMIVDADLPGVDAAAFARRVAGDPRVSAVRTILLNHDGPANYPAAANDVYSYLAKPVHQSQLYDCLTRSMTGTATLGDPPRLDGASIGERPAGQGVRRVLLVEDNEINQIVAVGILTGLGHQADVAGNGVEAVEMTRTQTYDAVLMDCRMPEMDGFTATAEIRRREGTDRHTPIIAMTASARVADRVRCLAAEMDDYIAKPVNAQELATILNRWMSVGDDDATPDTIAVTATPNPEGDSIVRRLDELLGGHTAPERALIHRLVSSFLSLTPGRMAGLSDAILSADAAGVAEQAHSFRGAADNIGAAGIAEICRRLETQGDSGSITSSATDDLGLLRTEMIPVDAYLQSMLETVG
jgi:PAS domain S-box-containing protein